MKKTLLIIAVMALSLTVTLAQLPPQSVPSPTGPTDSLRYIGSARVDTTSLTKVQATAIPPALRTTLKDSKYSGWEKGTLYHDPKTKGYILQLSTETAGTDKKPNWFKFDSKGVPITDPKRKKN